MKRLLLRLLITLAVTVVATVAALPVIEWRLQTQVARQLYHLARVRLHPFMQVVPGPDLVDRMNWAGFRGEEIEVQKVPGTFRIFAIGGSTTLGIANAYNETYPYFLLQLLRERYPGRQFEVQNAGIDWHATPHILINYELRVRRYQPDLVIVFEAMNDLYRSFSPPWFARGDYQPDYSHYLGPYARFLGPEVMFIEGAGATGFRDWLIWRNLRQRILGEPTPNGRSDENIRKIAARFRAVDVRHFRSFESFMSNYDLLVRLIQGDGHAVIVGSQPSLYKPRLYDEERALLVFGPVFCTEHGRYPNTASLMRAMQIYNAGARRVAESRHVPFLDFDGAVPKTVEYFSDDVHLKASANRILARLIFESMEKDRVLEGPRVGARHAAK